MISPVLEEIAAEHADKTTSFKCTSTRTPRSRSGTGFLAIPDA